MIRQPVRANRPQVREIKVPCVEFQDVSAGGGAEGVGWCGEGGDGEFDAALDYADFVG